MPEHNNKIVSADFGMIQAVIDQLRNGMDEIRAILRNKRPEKYRLAQMQLEKLCEDCRSKGIEAELIIWDDFSAIPEKLLEVILDNSFEAGPTLSNIQIVRR